ncbi:MAG TPA: acetyl-CoA carboxylase, carboxyltransferase subunit beta [Oscillospiraceae bacterium]|nr:acetyl-CoA carboxylase, carboxyltransferase subunit beta [Oscillospiraceae bacterium]
MLDDLFKVMRKRLNDDEQKPEAKSDAKADDKSGVEIPEDLLFKCPRCTAVLFMEEFSNRHKVCPSCNYHSRLTYVERLAITCDKGSFTEYDKTLRSLNPIDFPDYEKKVTDLETKYDIKDAVVTGECTIRGYRTCIAIMDTRFMMGSMGSVVGEKLARLFEAATEFKMPVVVFAASGGARMQEGIVSLMQMAKTSGAVAKHSEAGLLYITVLTDPTTGGVTASFASLGDIIIAEPKVLVGFAGRRVIEDTIRQRLPDDFQSAEFMQDVGFVDSIVERKKMRKALSTLLKLHGVPKEVGEI